MVLVHLCRTLWRV